MSDSTVTLTSDLTGDRSGRRSGWSDEVVSSLKSYLERKLVGWSHLPVPKEDLIGEVLLRLLASNPGDIKQPCAYAGVVLRNLIRDKIRELARAQRVFEKLGQLRSMEERGEKNEVSPDGEGTFEEGEFLRFLFDKTDLSPLQEKVLHMMYYAGHTISEIARCLARNPGTVQRHHDRAIQKLARCAARLEARG